MVAMQKKAGNNLRTSRKLDSEQNYRLHATMIRVMKKEKKLKFSRMAKLVLEELKKSFTPTEEDLHKSAEYLVENGMIQKLAPDEFEYIP
jgi:hypothetical protein